MAEVQVHAEFHELRDVAARLKAAGDKELRRETLRGLRSVAKPTIPKIRAHARASLPSRGGLGEAYAQKKITVRNSLSPSRATVSIVSTSPGRLRDVNAGRLRHPVFGDRETWRQPEPINI